MLFTSFSHDETDEQLMERFAFRNSEKAFEELYCRYAPGLKVSLCGCCRQTERWQMISQELFLRVYEARGSYQHGKQFSTWAFAMAYNLCKNEYRHRDIVDEYRLQQSYTNEEDSYSSLEFEAAHDRQVFDRQLKKVLAGLTDEQRAAYTLRYEEELPVQEIAQILCCPEGTVKSRLYYTLKVLQRSLSDYNPKNR